MSNAGSKKQPVSPQALRHPAVQSLDTAASAAGGDGAQRRLSSLKRSATLRLLRKCCSPRSLLLLRELSRYRSTRLSQEEELRNLLSFCTKNVPYYRRTFAGLPADRSIQFCDLPIMTKATVQRNFADLIALGEGGAVRGSPPFWIINTSGSTGVPSPFLKSRADMLANMLGVTEIFRQHGVPRMGHIFDLGLHWRGRPLVEARVFPGAFVSWNLQTKSFDTPSVRQLCLDVVATARPEVIFGAPSRLIPFAELCASTGALPRPHLVISTYEHLSPTGAQYLSETFDCTVVQVYGTAETGMVGWTCQFGRWHFDQQAVAVELVDSAGRYVAPGESGRLLVTPLGRRTMPLIRFDTGDIGRSPVDRCPCGRAGQVLDAVEGRASRLLETASGKRVSPFTIFRYISDLGVTDWQLVQRRPGEIEIILPEAAGVREDDVQRITRQVNTYLEEDTSVLVESSGNFFLEPNGKRSAFVRFEESKE